MHIFYGQIRVADNDSGLIFWIWPKPGSKIRKHQDFQFSKILKWLIFWLNQRIWPICLRSTGSYLAVPRTSDKFSWFWPNDFFQTKQGKDIRKKRYVCGMREVHKKLTLVDKVKLVIIAPDIALPGSLFFLSFHRRFTLHVFASAASDASGAKRSEFVSAKCCQKLCPWFLACVRSIVVPQTTEVVRGPLKRFWWVALIDALKNR